MNISLLSWYCGKNWKNTIKKLQKSGMSGIWTRDRQLQCRARSLLNHWDTCDLVTAADQTYLIITDVLIYCTVVVTMSRDVDRK